MQESSHHASHDEQSVFESTEPGRGSWRCAFAVALNSSHGVRRRYRPESKAARHSLSECRLDAVVRGVIIRADVSHDSDIAHRRRRA